MSAVKGRAKRRYDEGNEPVLLQGRVDRSIRAKASRAADAAGITMAAYLEALIERDEVDAAGRPLWLPVRDTDQQELPLRTA